jgi:putative cardiolipin synthase
MGTLSIALAVLAGLALFLYLAVYSYGRFARHEQGEPSVSLDVSEGRTALDAAIAPLLEKHPGETGLQLLSGNLHAFAVRAAAARNAGRSLDLQYYYWKDDLTGRLLANEVLMAADRGVRVRLLLDDVNVNGRDANYCAFDAHPNIEVRLFNPCRSRDGPFRRGLEMLLRYYSVVRRMHNKAWIVDGRLAIVGGRNIGDAYFDAAEASNFRDMDVLMVGPAVQQTEAIFDAYWNSSVVIPIKILAGSRRGNLPKLRQALQSSPSHAAAIPYLGRVLEQEDVQDMLAGIQKLHWTASARVVSDPPEKAYDGKRENWLIKAIMPAVASARSRVEIVSPYFIPGEDGANIRLDLAAKGVSVSVLTNSLAATDVSAVHGAYARYRKRLIKGGIRLFELRPREARQDISLFGSSGASLHTKAFLVDGRTGFVGSFNFDPRSASLNTEMGIMFDHAELAREVQAVFAQEMSPRRSYRVVLGNGAIGWEDGPVGAAKLLGAEPEASLRRRMIAMLVGLLPIEEQL